MHSMWVYFAIAASMLWGLVYSLDEQLYKYISVPTALAIASFFGFVTMLIFAIVHGDFAQDVRSLTSSRHVMVLMTVVTIVFIAAECCIGFSISGKNATLAALLEISYPLFTAIFAMLLFREAIPSFITLVGAVLIGMGVAIISWANK